MSFLVAAPPAIAATPSTLAVVVVGPGTVTSTPAGISCPAKCSASFSSGTTVTVTAKTANGSHLMRWGGACSGAGACIVNASGLDVVGAQFTAPTASVQPVSHSVAVPGAYAGYTSQGFRGSFLITPGGGSIRNISVAATAVACVPGGSRYQDLFWIPEATVKANGSFAATGSQTGVWAGYKASFSYSFMGNLEAATAKGPARGTGSLRENITYNNGTTYQCTTNNQTWSATLSGPKLPSALVPVQGDYSGYTSQGFLTTFSVASGGLVNISIPATSVTCAPGGSRYQDQLAIAHGRGKPGRFLHRHGLADWCVRGSKRHVQLLVRRQTMKA